MEFLSQDMSQAVSLDQSYTQLMNVMDLQFAQPSQSATGNVVPAPVPGAAITNPNPLNGA